MTADRAWCTTAADAGNVHQHARSRRQPLSVARANALPGTKRKFPYMPAMHRQPAEFASMARTQATCPGTRRQSMPTARCRTQDG
ncbi:hypothetical protein CBM2604_B60156 [Cupriavidus taiwanensis]|nr:hypothetical protein CBM2604_B60156 [Cupriavidus taiwanensis]